MIGILLVTHGRLAEELRAAALTIQPGLERIVAVALEWSETGEDAREKIRRGLEQADEGDGGVNLPMVLKCAALQRSGRPVTEVAHVAKDRGQRSIYVASDLLAEEAAPAG